MGGLQFLCGPGLRALGVTLLLTGWGGLAAGCGAKASPRTRALGDAAHGSRLIDAEACGSCHVVPGHATGIGMAGPPLSAFGRRTVIAGMLPNTPDNLVFWLQRPQAVVPANGMPDMGLSPQEARDIAAYLYTLR
jgi:cytochrome c2